MNSRSIRYKSYRVSSVCWGLAFLLLVMSCGNKETLIENRINVPDSVQTKVNFSEKDPPALKTLISKKPLLRVGAEPLDNKFIAGNKIYFDPHLATSNEELELANLLFSRLFTYNPTGDVVPMLVKTWEMVKLASGYTYVLHLIDMEWGDGSELDAHQVKASLLRAMDPSRKNPRAAELALAIRGGAEFYGSAQNLDPRVVQTSARDVQIRAIDSKTVYISTSSNGVDLIKVLATPLSAILPISNFDYWGKEIFDLSPALWSKKGPYYPTRTDRNKIVLTADASFLGKSRIIQEEIEFNFQYTLHEQIDLYAEGELDFVYLPYSLKKLESLGSISQDSYQKIFNRIRKQEMSAMVFLHIPGYSLLRYSIYTLQGLNAFGNNIEGIHYNTQLSDNVRNRLNTTLKSISVELREALYLHNEVSSLSAQRAERVFFPYSLIPPSSVLDIKKDVAESIAVEDVFIPKEILDASQDLDEKSTVNEEGYTREENDDIFDTKITDVDFSKNEDYFEIVRSVLRRRYFGIDRIRIAYNEPFLKAQAESIQNYFESLTIPSELIFLRPTDTPRTKDYDIAIRLGESQSKIGLGILSQYWWLLAGNEAGLNKARFGEFKSLIDTLSNTDDGREYLVLLNKIEKDLLDTSRIMPLWYLPKRVLIDDASYPWWTPLNSYFPTILRPLR